MKNNFNSPVAIILLCFSVSQNVEAQNNSLFNITPIVGTKYFYWGEYSNSLQNLEEYGFLWDIGVNSKTKFSRAFDLYIYSGFDVYYGIVNYNGYLQDQYGNSEPYKNETAYLGLGLNLNLGYDVYLSRYFIFSPEFGFGYELWERDVDNGGQYGYAELWNLALLNFGCGFTFSIPPSSKIYLKILGNFPVAITESIDLSARGGPSEINLEPEPNPGISLELGTVIYGAHLSFYMEYILFSPSALDQGYHQPESDRNLTGLKLGYQF